MEMRLFDDYTLSEIAESLSVTRQAVHDMLRRSEELLSFYEERLGLLRRFSSQTAELGAVYDALRELPSSDEAKKTEILDRLFPFTGRDEPPAGEPPREVRNDI